MNINDGWPSPPPVISDERCWESDDLKNCFLKVRWIDDAAIEQRAASARRLLGEEALRDINFPLIKEKVPSSGIRSEHRSQASSRHIGIDSIFLSFFRSPSPCAPPPNPDTMRHSGGENGAEIGLGARETPGVSGGENLRGSVALA